MLTLLFEVSTIFSFIKAKNWRQTALFDVYYFKKHIIENWHFMIKEKTKIYVIYLLLNWQPFLATKNLFPLKLTTKVISDIKKLP